MSIDADAYKRAAYPPPLHEPDLRDEDVAALLDRTARRSRAARKAHETMRQKRAEQAATQEKEGTHAE